MEKEIERIKSLLGFHYFIHERIFNKSRMGYITKNELLLVLRRNHNIPKDECKIILRGLEILGLIEKEGGNYLVKKPKGTREELIFEFRKKLNLI